MKIISTVLLTMCLSFLYSQNSSGKFHRAAIYYSSKSEISILEAAGIAMDHGLNKKNTYFESDFSDSEIEKAKSLGFKVEIIIENVSSFYINQNNPDHKDYFNVSASKNTICNTSIAEYQTPVNYDIKAPNSFGGFYNYTEILQELDDMHAQYPNLITSRSEIKDPSDTSSPHKHETEQGRYLQWVKISDNANINEDESQILYTALHHAREPASLQQLIFFMWYLLENYDTNNEIKAIVNSTELFFIPVVNPDGYIYNETTNPFGGGLWRKNRRNNQNGSFGVDLNRNYSYITANGEEVWNTSGTSNNTFDNTYAGTMPFSEPETRAVRYFVETHNFKIALNNHTYSELLLYPFGYAYNQPTVDDLSFISLTELMVSQNGYNNIISSDLYPAAGDSDDFMYGLLTTESGEIRSKIFAMTPEIGSSFWPPASNIEAICKEMVYHNLSAAKLTGNYASLIDLSPTYSNNINTNASYSLQKIGLTDTGDFTVSINALSNNILSVGNDNIYSDLSHLESVNGSISINLNPQIVSGDAYTYELIINNGSTTETQIITKFFGQPITIFDEIGNDTASNWLTSNWASTTEEFVSLSSSITDSPNSNYSNNDSNTLTMSSEIDLTGSTAANLTFKAKWDIESNYDYVQIEISTDNGNSWLPQCGNYTNEGVENQFGAVGEPVYDGSQNDWVEEYIDLSDYLNESILIRFILISDASVTKDGFYFDDLKINTFQNTLTLDNLDKEYVKFYPNPIKKFLNLESSKMHFTVRILNLQGQLIYKSNTISNHLKVDCSEFSSGLYFLKINSKNGVQTFKIIKK